ncbi:MAG: PAS domain S-box protein [Planctomycetota bacterium]
MNCRQLTRGISLIDRFDVPMVIVDDDARMLKMNRAWEDLFSNAVPLDSDWLNEGADVLAKCAEVMVESPEQVPSVLRFMRSLLAEDPPVLSFSIPLIIREKQDWFRVRALEWEDLGPMRVLVFEPRRGTGDFSEHLRRHEATVQAIVSTAADGIVTIDEGGVVLSFNTAAEKLFGYDSEEIVGRNVRMLVPAPHAEKHDDYIASYLRTRASGVIGIAREVHGLRKDGLVMPLHLSVSEYWEDDERRFTGILRDMSRIKAAEEELRQLNRALYQRVVADQEELKQKEEQLIAARRMEAIGRLAGGVAHDFNNLLTIIMGYTDLVQAQTVDPRSKESLFEVRFAAERASALVRQLLAFGRQQVLKPQLVDLNQAVRGIASLLCRTLGENIVLELDLYDRPCYIHVDPSQIEQVILNLAINARDAMPEGGFLRIQSVVDDTGELSESTSRLANSSGTLLIVTDTGTGMDERVRSRIFEPFFTTKEVGKGTGLGLSTVYGIVKQSNGEIQVESEVGKGSTFRIHFPSANLEAERADQTLQESFPGNGDETILIAEDDPQVRSILVSALTKAGYRTVTVGSVGEASRILDDANVDIDLLLADLVLEDGTGRALADHAKQCRPRLGRIFMSGYLERSVNQEDFLRLGIPFLPKPIPPRALLRLVRQVLDERAKN